MERIIYLAGGCFWGTEHFMKKLKGVTSTQVGYANSLTPSPTYAQVCTGETAAVETVRVTYNDSEIALSFLLEMFFLTIDPTSLNQQGGDIGTQYRTGIYYTDSSDFPIAHQALETLRRKYTKPLAIELLPLASFYTAEEYHQAYLTNNPGGYCHVDRELFALAMQASCPPQLIEADQSLRP